MLAPLHICWWLKATVSRRPNGLVGPYATPAVLTIISCYGDHAGLVMAGQGGMRQGMSCLVQQLTARCCVKTAHDSLHLMQMEPSL